MPPDGTGGTVRTRDSGQEDGRCQGSVTVGVRLKLVHDHAEAVDFLSGPPVHAEHPRSARNPVPRTVSGRSTSGYTPVLACLNQIHDSLVRPAFFVRLTVL